MNGKRVGRVILVAAYLISALSSSAQNQLPTPAWEDDQWGTRISDDGEWYQLWFLTQLGVLYEMESTRSLGAWDEPTSFWGTGEEMVWTLGPRTVNQVPLDPLPPHSATISLARIANNGGTVMRWTSKETGLPMARVLNGQVLHQQMRPFAQFEAEDHYFIVILDPQEIPQSDIPYSSSGSGADQRLSDLFISNFATFNAELANTRNEAIPPVAPGPKGFFRVRRSYWDSDGDGYSNHYEISQGLNWLDRDTDKDGLIDSADGNPLENAAVADPDGAGLPASAETGLLGRWDLETVSVSGGQTLTPPKTGSHDMSLEGGALWHPTQGVTSHGANLSGLAAHLEVDGDILHAKTSWALGIWIRLQKDQLDTQTADMELMGYGYRNPTGTVVAPLYKAYINLVGKLVVESRQLIGPVNNLQTTPHGSVQWDRPDDIDDGRWHHLVLTRSGNSFGFLYDGAAYSQGGASTQSLTASTLVNYPNIERYLKIGATTGIFTQSNFSFQGEIDRIRLYSSPMAASTALTLYDQDADLDFFKDRIEGTFRHWNDKGGPNDTPDNLYDPLEQVHFWDLNPLRYDPLDADHDKDGIISLFESQTVTSTSMGDPDSDNDLLPDGWEQDHGLDPTVPNIDQSGDHVDTDGDGLSDFDEWVYGADPNNPNTDGEGGTDSEEVDNGRDPTEPGDEENPPEFSEITFRVGDSSGSESERWVMLIQQKKEDGQDGRLIRFASKNFGQVEERAFKLANEGSYEITLEHQDTSEEQKEKGFPDYDWEAQVEGKFTEPVLTEDGAFTFKKEDQQWLVVNGSNENESGLLGVHEGSGNGGNETKIDKTIGRKSYLLPVDLTVDKAKLTLLEENTLKVDGADKLPDGLLDGVKFEIKRDGEATCYEIQDGAATEFKGKARVAGKFKVRATLDLDGKKVQTEEEAIEVQFPDAATVLAGDGVRARMDQAWTNTKNTTTPTTRREEGYYITLDTSEGNEKYGITKYTVGNVVNNNQGAKLDGFGGRPKDVPENPNPVQSSVYAVAWFHTHTPMTYRLPAARRRKVGPSAGDKTFSAHAAVNCPGFAYDYAPSPATGDTIPGGHPINSPAEISEVTPPDRRPTP